MNRLHCSRAFLLAVLGALAMLALPGAAAAKRRDRNHDRIPDRWEKRHHLSLKVKQTGRDQDGDHLRNRQEFLAGTNPRNPDSDGDGVPDGQENAGRIRSFDAETGQLVIDLFGGETASGLVTEETEVECEGGQVATASHSGEDAGEGDRIDGSAEANGGDEVSDDEGDDSSTPESPSTGSESAGDEGDEAGGSNCTTADLVEGAIVKEAELKLDNGTATFEEVELAG